jgi:flagellar biogenesis protein FliO
MEDKKLKDMWTQMNEYLNYPKYGSGNIEEFMGRKSKSIFNKIKENLTILLGFKTFILCGLIFDFIFYTHNIYVQGFALISAILLVYIMYYEFMTLRKIRAIHKNTYNINQHLSELLSFIEENQTGMILSASTTNLFGFPGLMLMYFYLLYGQIKPMPVFGFFVMGVLFLIGVIGGYIIQKAQLDSHINHLRTCIDKMDNEMKMYLSNEVEAKGKQNIKIKVLIMFIIILVFIVIVALLKKFGIG